ncbi:MAG: hypothetical protein HZB66_01405 [Candidatus Aenigmarchaeota archaeon]|nr:hypothetical protein [Candidatus Aenigmarchaeota archaeon]
MLKPRNLELSIEYKNACLARIDVIRKTYMDGLESCLREIPSLKADKRQFYPCVFSVTDPVTQQPLYVGIKTDIYPEWDVASHNLFYGFGFPVASFCGIVRYNNQGCLVTEDLTNGGICRLHESRLGELGEILEAHDVINRETLEAEFQNYCDIYNNIFIFKCAASYTDFVRSWFLQVDPENRGRWFLGDMDKLTADLPPELIREFCRNFLTSDVMQTPEYTIRIS